LPLYEYKCLKCGAVFEVLQRNSSAKPVTTHKDCGGPVERLVSTSAFHFKGTGWYATDYAKKSGSEASHPKKTEPAKPTPKAEPTTPTTPAAPSTTK